MMKDLSMLQQPKYTGILEEEEPKTPEPTKEKKKTTAKKEQGRPPLPIEEKRNVLVKVYLTRAERENLTEKISNAAEGFKISDSQFLRKLLSDNDLI